MQTAGTVLLLAIAMACAAPAMAQVHVRTSAMTGQARRRAQTQAGNGCATILQSAVYRSFYEKYDTANYTSFEAAICSLPSTSRHQLVLPLSPTDMAKFKAAAEVLAHERDIGKSWCM